MVAQKIGLLKGFAQGAVWEGQGGSRILLPFQDTVISATMAYTGELAMTETFSDQGILGASQACLQKEAVEFTLESSDLSWSMLLAATLSSSVARTAPVMVSETFTASDVDDDNTVHLLSAVPVVTAPELVAAGLPGSGVSVADINGSQIVGTLTGSTLTLDDDYTGSAITVHYLRAPLDGEETIYLGSGDRREQVGFYGKFFGCPGSLLVVAPRCAVQPNLSAGVSDGSTASLGLSLKALRTNGYFAEITRLKDCVGC
jgi:hypothetical protein